jgi:electron transport complex protein RnfC
MGVRAFLGILPPKIPYSTSEVPVEALPLPEKATLLWKHGAPEDLTVRAGNGVLTGQNLARERKRPFISTVTGEIQEIGSQRGPDGQDWVAVTLAQIHEDRLDPLNAIQNHMVLAPGKLLSALTRAGVPGLCPIAPDAAHPEAPGVAIEALVISALDADPLSVVNAQVLRESADRIEAGIRLLSRAVGVQGAIFAVPEPLADTARAIPGADAWVVPIPPIYPNGLPEMLARRVGAGSMLALNGSGVVGNTLVVSLEHLVAMTGCLEEGRPWVEKIVTCSVNGAGEFKNLRVRIGTPVSAILAHLGVELQPHSKLLIGGALRGYACFSAEQPIAAWSDSVHLQGPEEVFRYDESPCTNCGQCNSICPIGLEVNMLGRFSEYGLFEKCRELAVDNCVECGLCAYVCPARRPLVQYLVHAKSVLARERSEKVEQE